MAHFPRNFRDTLLRSANTRTLLIAALIVAALFVVLVIAYTAFDFGGVLPRRRP
jgi:hypothetical protein